MKHAPVLTNAAELHELAVLVNRLRPDWRDGEAFYELRSEIAGRLRELSRTLGPLPDPARSRPCVLPPKAVRPPAGPRVPPVAPSSPGAPYTAPPWLVLVLLAATLPPRHPRRLRIGRGRTRYPRPPGLPDLQGELL